MKLVKLNAIDSTNSFLKDLQKDSEVENFTVVTAKTQTKGKGQLQNKWLSESGKNLTFSVLVLFDDLLIENSFYLNVVTSLAVFEVLEKHIPEKLKIKWPNDILSFSKKICGILIENTVSEDKIIRSVIGIGLNVNQTNFDGLPNASSLKLIANKKFDKDALLVEIVDCLKSKVALINRKEFRQLKSVYEASLFRINMPAMYKNQLNQQFMGKILGISDTGKLLVELENETVSSFDLKEIIFI